MTRGMKKRKRRPPVVKAWMVCPACLRRYYLSVCHSMVCEECPTRLVPVSWVEEGELCEAHRQYSLNPVGPVPLEQPETIETCLVCSTLAEQTRQYRECSEFLQDRYWPPSTNVDYGRGNDELPDDVYPDWDAFMPETHWR